MTYDENLYLGTDERGTVTVIGNEHYLDGRVLSIEPNGNGTNVCLTAEEIEPEPIVTLPSYQDAAQLYESAVRMDTLDDLLAKANAYRQQLAVEQGQWVVYLLHFDRKIGEERIPLVRAHYGNGPRVKPYNEPHAGHYLGATNDFNARVKIHRNGNGTPLVAKLMERGGDFTVSRLWRDDNSGNMLNEQSCYALEKRLKSWKNSPKFCPICVGA